MGFRRRSVDSDKKAKTIANQILGIAMTQTVEWFFGRGISIGCGLAWSVPDDWKSLPREVQIPLIIDAILQEMSTIEQDPRDLNVFLDILAAQTRLGWQHRFHTTNWDYLLQRVLTRRFPTGSEKPNWLASSHVYHHNGTVEVATDNSHRSPILLESDSPSARTPSLESNKAFNELIWARTFVVVGMSFECSVDKFLFKALSRVQENLPVGESYWLVVNPSRVTLRDTRNIICDALPTSTVRTIRLNFNSWLAQKFPELQSRGVLIPCRKKILSEEWGVSQSRLRGAPSGVQD